MAGIDLKARSRFALTLVLCVVALLETGKKFNYMVAGALTRACSCFNHPTGGSGDEKKLLSHHVMDHQRAMRHEETCRDWGGKKTASKRIPAKQMHHNGRLCYMFMYELPFNTDKKEQLQPSHSLHSTHTVTVPLVVRWTQIQTLSIVMTVILFSEFIISVW